MEREENEELFIYIFLKISFQIFILFSQLLAQTGKY